MVCWVYSLKLRRWGDFNEYNKVQFHDKKRKIPLNMFNFIFLS